MGAPKRIRRQGRRHTPRLLPLLPLGPGGVHSELLPPALPANGRKHLKRGLPRCHGCKATGHGGETGIRTPGTLLEYTRFPGEYHKPLGHLSGGTRIQRSRRIWALSLRSGAQRPRRSPVLRCSLRLDLHPKSPDRGDPAVGLGRQARAQKAALPVPGCRCGQPAESEGFEPPIPFGTPDFESGSFSHSDSSPWVVAGAVRAENGGRCGNHGAVLGCQARGAGEPMAAGRTAPSRRARIVAGARQRNVMPPVRDPASHRRRANLRKNATAANWRPRDGRPR